MASYSVVAGDGQRYGPVDEAGLAAWVHEGRVARETPIYCHETNQTTPARDVAVIAAMFPPPPNPQAAKPQSANWDGSRAPGAPGLHPLQRESQLGYATPYGTPMFPNGHELSDFPVVGIVLLDIFVPIFSVIWFNLMHGKINRTRPDDPGAGKAIGFSFIPFFNIWYWNFFTYRRLVARVNQQRIEHGLPPADVDGLALTMCILWACLIPIVCVPFLSLLWILAIKVVSCVFFAKLQQAVNELVIATRMRGFSVLPQSQAAPIGPR